MNNIWFHIIFWGFIAFYLYVTFVLGKKHPTIGQFYNMNQSAGPFLIAGTYTATWISAFGMIGVAGVSYSVAPLSGILMWGAMIGFVITGFAFGPRLRRFGQVTLGDYFGARFDSPLLQVISAAIVIVGLLAYFVSQTMGSAIVTEMIFGIDYNVMVIVMTIIFVIIAVTAGAQSVTITDTIMMATIAVALGYLFAPSLLYKVGIDGFTVHAKQNPAFYTYGGGKIAFSTIVGWQIIWALGNASMPQALTRCYLAKNNTDWYKSILMALMLTLSIVWLTHMASAGVKILNPGLEGNKSLLWASKNAVSPLIGAFAAAGLFAAALSSATTQVLYLAFAVTRDIYEKYFQSTKTKKEVIEKKLLLLTRIWIVIFGVLGAIFAIWKPAELVQFGNLAASIFASSFFPPLLLGLYWQKCTKQGAFFGMIGGFVAILFLSYLGLALGKKFGDYSYLPFGLSPIYWGVCISFSLVFVGSLLTSVTPSQEKVFKMTATPGEVDYLSDKDRKSLIKWVYVAGVYLILQTTIIVWFSTKV